MTIRHINDGYHVIERRLEGRSRRTDPLVILIHLAVNACAHLPEFLQAEQVRTLLFLPLAHVLGRFIELLVVCSPRGVLGHTPDVKNLVTDLSTFRPTFVTAVPRIFEKIYNAADARSTGPKQKIFRMAAETALA